jgi:hypothetical protein
MFEAAAERATGGRGSPDLPLLAASQVHDLKASSFLLHEQLLIKLLHKIDFTAWKERVLELLQTSHQSHVRHQL